MDPGISAAREILGAAARGTPESPFDAETRVDIAPFGLQGGAPGDVGGGRLLRAGGGTEEIGATASFKVEVGDVLTILTPGGGGFGAAGGDVGAIARSGGTAMGAADTQGGDLGASGGIIVAAGRDVGTLPSGST